MDISARRLTRGLAAELALAAVFAAGGLGGRRAAQAQGSAAPSGAEVRPSEDQASPADADAPSAVETSESIIRQWPALPQGAARVMLAKYGRPNEFTETALIWFNNGPWKKTVVHKTVASGRGGPRARDYLEQAVTYHVPSDKVAELSKFDRAVAVDPIRGELSARSDSENLNFLAINLADEIVTGKRSVEEARDFMRRTTQLSRAGKSSRYLDGLLFETHNERAVSP